MNKLTIKIDDTNLENEKLKNYLLSLKGVNDIVKDDSDDQVITIQYSKDKTLYMIIKEMLLYLDVGHGELGETQ